MDKGALNGLRGLIAFHVMTYHAFTLLIPSYSKFVIVNYANVDMPLFFLLSGFCLTLAYGNRHWNGSIRRYLGCKSTTSDGVRNLENFGGETKIFDSWKFYKKRFIRILPLHYLTTIAALAINQYGYNDFSSNKVCPCLYIYIYPVRCINIYRLSLCVILYYRAWPERKEAIGAVLSIFAVNTWFIPYKIFGPNPPSWTICTLSFWYWCFPFLLPRIQRLTDNELAYGIIRCFWLQIVLALLFTIGLGGFVDFFDARVS